MLSREASSEIAQSRERFEKWAIRGKQEGVPVKFYLLEFDKLSLDPVQYKDELTQAAFAIWERAERDTQERCAQIARSYAELCGLMTERGKICTELAERIRGKEVSR